MNHRIPINQEEKHESFKYLSPAWTQEAYRRLRAELDADKMKHVTSSMLTVYVYRFVDGSIDGLSIRKGERPEAEYRIIGDYETFARIRKEMRRTHDV